MHVRPTIVALILAAGSILAAPAAHAQSSPAPAFTFQGRLDDGSAPAQGTYQMYFTLFDAPTGGNTVATYASAASPASVSVQDGLFTLPLDFPAAAYSGAERYLEIAVRGPSGGSYTTLAGRQRLSPTPYASFSSTTRGVNVDAAGRVTVGGGFGAYRFNVAGGVDGNAAALTSTATDFTLLAIQNGSAGGHLYSLLSTGGAYPSGAGDFVVRDVSAAADRLTIDANGNVGIGPVQLNPAGYGRTLTITSGSAGANGSASLVFNNTALAQQWNMGIGSGGPLYFDKFGGGSNVVSVPVLEIRGGSDIAEPYDVAPAGDLTPTPGMVVTIDPDGAGTLRVATSPYDHAVAGIISGANGVNTGLTLTQKGTKADGQWPIASMGRVWCYVDADANGPVRPGDLLTTSATPGHAMRADPAAAGGAVLGKAMSRLDSGKGMVLVLVGLQ